MRSPYRPVHPRGDYSLARDTPRLVAGLPWIRAALPHGARWNSLAALFDSLVAASRLPWGISPRSALRLSVRGSPHAHAARSAPRGDDSPSAAGFTRGPLSPGFRGGFLGPSDPSLRGGSWPDFSPGSPLARGIRGDALPESGYSSALVSSALGPCVMVWCVQRGAVSARPALGLVFVFPRGTSHRNVRRGRFGCPVRFASGGASVAKRRGARPPCFGR